jgi:hypothetical protein
MLDLIIPFDKRQTYNTYHLESFFSFIQDTIENFHNTFYIITHSFTIFDHF